MKQGMFSKKVVGLEREIELAPGQSEKDVEVGLIIEVFNIFISQKLTFDKRDKLPMNIDVKFKDKELLFAYSIYDDELFLLALKTGKDLEAIRLVLTPSNVAGSKKGRRIASLLDEISSPYFSRKE